MYERQNTRTLDDSISSLEQDLQPQWAAPSCRSNPMPPADIGSDRNVLSDVDRWNACRPGSIQCTVAGLVHCYAYTWTDHPQLPGSFKCRKLNYLRVLGYRGGYSGLPGFSDNLQPGPVAGQPATLEVAAPRAMGPEYTIHHLYIKRQEAGHRRTVRYSCVGPGETEPVCCVVGSYPVEFRRNGHSLPSVTCNRCDLDAQGNRTYYSYVRSGENGPKSLDRVQTIDTPPLALLGPS